MTQLPLPKLKRKAPKGLAYIFCVILYGIIVPINWVLIKLGRASALMTFIHQKQIGGSAGPGKIFAEYTPTKQDVFVSTFAKSGTNWMMQMCHQIAFHGEGEFDHIHDVVCWSDMPAKSNERMFLSIKDELVPAASPENLRVIKTHFSGKYVPYNEDAHYVVVVRDPKEIYVSSYHFAKGTYGPLMPTPEVWFDLFVSGRFPLDFGSSWAEHTASYWALRDKPNVLILSYTQMKKDLEGTVKQVSDFLGASLTAGELATVAEKSSFAYMSNIDDKFAVLPKGTLPWEESKMMRQGKTGNAKEMISLEQQIQIDNFYQQELKRLGSDFPYEEFCSIKQPV